MATSTIQNGLHDFYIIGDGSESIADSIANNIANFPNYKTLLCRVSSSEGLYYGFLAHYTSGKYGCGILTNYNNKAYKVFISNYTVTLTAF